MKQSEKTKHIQDIPADNMQVRVAKPFKLSRENTRRFIRLEISSPMSLQKIKDNEGNYWPEGDWHIINGTILNISASGVLVDLDQAVEEGDFVSMHFSLQGVEALENVLGLVKRGDYVDEGCLAGIEFISKESLADHFSRPEMELLTDDLTNFDTSIQTVLSKYVTSETSDSERS